MPKPTTEELDAAQFGRNLHNRPKRKKLDVIPGATDVKKAPVDPWKAFAYFVGKCAEGFGAELLRDGKTDTQARNAIIHCFLDFAAGEACRIAKREGRSPDPKKWKKAVDDAFERAVRRTASA